MNLITIEQSEFSSAMNVPISSSLLILPTYHVLYIHKKIVFPNHFVFVSVIMKKIKLDANYKKKKLS